jgi:N-acetylmuramoyl-L-alanine amidase CwlA
MEICMNKGGNLLAATDRAAKLAAYVLAKRGHTVAVSGVNLYQHNHHSGKNCPQMLRSGKPYSWKTFVEKVNAYL